MRKILTITALLVLSACGRQEIKCYDGNGHVYYHEKGVTVAQPENTSHFVVYRKGSAAGTIVRGNNCQVDWQ